MPETLKNQEDSFDSLREKLVLAAVTHVPFTGWSEQTLVEAAKDSKIALNTAKILFPNIRVDLALAFHKWADVEFKRKLASENAEMRMRDKITYLVRSRLEVLQPHKAAISASFSLFSLPAYTGLGFRAVWQTMDTIWVLAGDSSKDYNWYTKRMTLMGVYSSTLLYFLEDKSEGNQQTWRFLEQRIDNVMQFEKFKATVRENPIAKRFLGLPLKFMSSIRKPDSHRKTDILSKLLDG